jgi:hypothetical protein
MGPATSRVSGAIGRGLADAAAGYRTHLAELFSPAIDGGTG